MNSDKLTLERARILVNTSVQDMQSGLYNYTRKDLPVLNKALAICKQRLEITKVNILERKIKQIEKGVQA